MALLGLCGFTVSGMTSTSQDKGKLNTLETSQKKIKPKNLSLFPYGMTQRFSYLIYSYVQCIYCITSAELES